VLLASLPIPRSVPVVGDTHNVEFDVLRRTAEFGDKILYRTYARMQEASTRREEQRCTENVNLLLATSERDGDLFKKQFNVADVVVIPNGIDLAEFAPTHTSIDPNAILFSGLMSYYPNEQGIRWFLNSVYPMIQRQVRNVRLTIAGADPSYWLITRKSSNVEITGRVSDMRPYLARSAVVIAPLHIAGGTRVKILEALAMGKPVVSTTVGAEGLHLRHRESILLADDPYTFAQCVVELIRDITLARRIGDNGRAHVRRFFDWNHIGERLRETLQFRLGLVAYECSTGAPSRLSLSS
jgi:glycosyltransferase involved in cell wall biosynthesis